MADKTLNQLIINKLSKTQYDAMSSHSGDELWFVTGSDLPVSWNAITNKPDTFLPSSHQHAGSEITTSVANATTAVKLTSTSGSATVPVYIKNGVPTTCSFFVSKSVPSDAVFTDTHYTNSLIIQGNGVAATTFTQDANKILNLKGSGSTSVSKSADGVITISSTDSHGTYGDTPGSGTASADSGYALASVSLSADHKLSKVSQVAIPAAANDAKITLTTNGISGSFTVNQSTAGTVNLTHTHSYNDLSNKPTIPTVGNGTITIQKNGNQVATFSVNQSTNATANIIVPVTPGDIGAAPTSHTHSKAEVGLGNVDNTADANKSVAYAGNADTVDNKHASDFATASHDHDDRYLKLTGGDITGNVHITGSLTNGGSTNGQYVLASGLYSHAEGAGSVSSGESAHAEGRETIASGDYSHAEGYGSEAQGLYSHAEGDHTVATQENQLVVGQYNDTSSKLNNYLFVVGNGSYESSQSYQPAARSNAFAVDKWGNIDIPEQSVLRGTAQKALSVDGIQRNEEQVIYSTANSSRNMTALSGYEVPSEEGQVKHIIIYNNNTAWYGTTTITITLNSGVVLGDTTIDIEKNKYGEINLLCANGQVFVRGIGS